MSDIWTNEYWLLAFVVTPLTVLAIGWIGAYLHMRDLRRNSGSNPGE